MRKIKFRGYTTELTKNEFVYGDLIHLDEHEVCVMEQDCRNWDVLESGYRVIPTTVGQFTGLKDLDGREIYEGDILRRMEGEGNEKYKVVFEEWIGSYALVNVETPEDMKEFSKFIIGARKLMIVGNIHEDII
jgi:putative prophage lp2 protein 26